MKRYTQRFFLILLTLLCARSTAFASFNLTININGGITPEHQTAFAEAEALWESVITGYQPGISLGGIIINASGINIDGVGGQLGNAGPVARTFQGGFSLTRTGSMRFDTADIADLFDRGLLTDVVKHEIGHILGIGTNWSSNGVYMQNSGEYTGQYGLAAFQEEFDAGALFVPVELTGGQGTANFHWDEYTGLSAGGGFVLDNELMTGRLRGMPTFLSNTTVQSLRDIGFEVTEVQLVPEPSSLALLSLLLGLACLKFSNAVIQ